MATAAPSDADAFFADLNTDMIKSDEEDLSTAWWWFYVMTGVLFVLFLVVVGVALWRQMRGAAPPSPSAST